MKKFISYTLSIILLALTASCSKEEVSINPDELWNEPWDNNTTEFYQRKDNYFPDRETYVYLEDHAESLALLQIDEAKLKKLSTMELVQVCMSFPYLHDYIFYEDLVKGINRSINNFNGFRVLHDRPDALFCLTKYYNSYLNYINSVKTTSPDEINPLELCSIELVILSGYYCSTDKLPNYQNLVNAANKSIKLRLEIPSRLYGETFSNPVANILITTLGLPFDKFPQGYIY
ncbi:MAG: hypothetical protein K2J74_01445 [Muribaculaceae bacterium]|nr:hypothetical protein [Muribaculaceae bacterium]